jgi:hypothetical protein
MAAKATRTGTVLEFAAEDGRGTPRAEGMASFGNFPIRENPCFIRGYIYPGCSIRGFSFSASTLGS